MKIQNTFTTFAVIMISHLVGDGDAKAGLASTTVREAAEHLLEKGGREVAEESVESIARKLGTVAEKYGPSGIEAVRKGGPTAFRYIVEGGEQGPKVVKLFEKYGDSAIHVVAHPKSMALFIKHGEPAAGAMIRHPGIAEDLITPFGAPAARALASVGGQNGRRLAMLAEEGVLQKTGRAGELFDVIARYGDRSMEFVWRNKGALVVSTTLAAFLANPELFINGTRDLAGAVVKPGIEKAGEVGVALATNNGGAIIGIAAMLATGAYFLRRRTAD